MTAAPRIIKSRYISLIVTLCLILVFFVLLNNVENVKVKKLASAPGDTGGKLPGEYLKYLKPNKTGYCNLNYGLPSELAYNKKEDVTGTPELNRSSPFQVLPNIIEGQIEQDKPGVTYVTQMTEEFVMYISEIVRFWEGPVSVAAYLSDGDPKIILESMLHFCYCVPEMSRLSLHFVFKKDTNLTFYLSRVMPPKHCDTQDLHKMIAGRSLSKSDISNRENSKAVNNWYPINVCRNVARQAAYTDFVLVSDVELMPSYGLASRFVDMTESYKCLVPEGCGKRVYVVPVFEVDVNADVPRYKSQLIDLLNTNRAVYFHQLSCAHCQKFPGLEQWKETDPGNVVKPLLETKREVPYHRWEPIYIGSKSEPLYYEKLSWEGFQDKMLQMLEMCLADYNLSVLDGAFLTHWPGIKTAKRKDEPWRIPYVKMNQDQYDVLLRNITSRYPPNPQCKVK